MTPFSDALRATMPFAVRHHPSSHIQPAPAQQDARDLQKDLAERLTPSAGANSTSPLKATQVLKVVLGIGLVAAFGVRPALNLLAPSSADAVLDARLITLRAPIDGTANIGDNGVTIANPRADSSAVEATIREIARLDAAIASNERRGADIEAALKNEISVAEAFHANRRRQLDARLDELAQREIVARLAHEEAAAKLERARRLAPNGFVSPVELERLGRSVAQMAAEAAAASALREQTAVERDAIASGQYVGDGYNDRPSTEQRIDDDRRRLSDVIADIAARRAERDAAATALERERERLAQASSQKLAFPVDARLWEKVVANGEHVQRGQVLARYVDCANPFILATVGESLYNRLSVGQRAAFEPAEGGAKIEGRVASLAGLSASDASYAIAPNSLTRAAFHVAITLPPSSTGCAIGRTGRVTF